MAGWLSERARNGGIDEIPLPAASGRLWLCGKHFIGPDPVAALERTGAEVAVCLNEADELAPRYPDYVQWLGAQRGDRSIWFPIPDLHIPPLDALRPLLDELHGRLTVGQGLVVHCGAGIGRAGTVAASLLILDGLSLDDALDVVAAARSTAGPQTSIQMELLEALAEAEAVAGTRTVWVGSDRGGTVLP